MFDLTPAAAQMSRLVQGVRDDQLDGPTPCEDWTVRQLVQHTYQFATVFTRNAHKEPFEPAEIELGSGDQVPDDWREQTTASLDALAEGWRQESAWQGQVSAGGVEMSAEQNALVGAEELTMHSWDLATATGQDFEPDEVGLDGVDGFFEAFSPQIEAGQSPFGEPVPVPDDAGRFERLLGRAGRDPGWTP